MSGRRLPVAPRPYRDELLSSWLGRVACRYGLDAAGLVGDKVRERRGLEPPQDAMLANRFANQLLRIKREMDRAPSGSLAQVTDTITRDTLGDIQKNLGDAAAAAAKPALAELTPLP